MAGARKATETAASGAGTAQAHTTEACARGDAALARAFDFLGKRWNAMVLGNLRDGPAGFRELSRVMGASVKTIDKHYGHLARDSEEPIRSRLEARSAGPHCRPHLG